MPDSLEMPRSNNHNALYISFLTHIGMEASFAGVLLGAMLYGVVVVLFFQCMNALFNPINRTREGVKWPLVAHTVAMFLFVTAYTAADLNYQCISYVDNREFPGNDELPPGPNGYQLFTAFLPNTFVPAVMFIVNHWLADGLLLYRCYIIYGMNYWIIAFPCLVYLSSLATGTAFIYQSARYIGSTNVHVATDNFSVPCTAISSSLNILLTLMIVTRLVLHRRKIRNAMGPLVKTGRLYEAVVTMLIESCSLHAVGFLLWVGLWAAGSPATYVFVPTLAETQVIGPFLIILRVANRRAVTSETIASGDIGSFHVDRRRSMSGDNILSDGQPASPIDMRGRTPSELSIVAETTIGLRNDDEWSLDSW